MKNFKKVARVLVASALALGLSGVLTGCGETAGYNPLSRHVNSARQTMGNATNPDANRLHNDVPGRFGG